MSPGPPGLGCAVAPGDRELLLAGQFPTSLLRLSKQYFGVLLRTRSWCVKCYTEQRPMRQSWACNQKKTSKGGRGFQLGDRTFFVIKIHMQIVVGYEKVHSLTAMCKLQIKSWPECIVGFLHLLLQMLGVGTFPRHRNLYWHRQS